MMNHILKLLIVFILLTFSRLNAQEQYTTELGIHAGGGYFLGDFQKINGKMKQPDIGITVKRVFNKRLSLMADYHFISVTGDATQPLTALFSKDVSITQSLYVWDIMMSVNFLDYGKLEYVLNSSNITPYLTAGFGVVAESFRYGKLTLNPGLPIGMGCKIRLMERLHLNLQWIHRLSLKTDGLEGSADLDNVIGLNGTNVLNNDQVGSFTIGMSYSLFRKKCNCFNYK